MRLLTAASHNFWLSHDSPSQPVTLGQPATASSSFIGSHR